MRGRIRPGAERKNLNRLRSNQTLVQVFISYPNKALKHAAQAKQIFRQHGYDTWFFEHDQPPIGNLDDVLRQAVRESDYVVHICTRHTRGSEGQRKERNFAAIPPEKTLVLLVFRPWLSFIFKPDFVPKDIEGNPMRTGVSPSSFVYECTRVARWLLRNDASEVREDDPIKVPEEYSFDD